MKKFLLIAAALVGSAGFAGAAQAQISITRVQDASGNFENTTGKSATSKTFTSPPVTVIADEYFVGGRNRIYRLGGQQIFPSTTTQSLCTSSYRTCRSGETVTGVRLTINLGQLGAGREFFIQDTGVYSPYPTYSTSIVIN